MKEVESKLRTFSVDMPPVLYQVEGIRVFGRTLRSFLFSTDVALIRNTNTDAVLAMYPFAPQPVIHRALLAVSDQPVFVGIGSVGVPDERLIRCACDAEDAGACGIVLGPHVAGELISKVKRAADIPVIATVASDRDSVESKIDSGADILNVSGAQQTPEIVASLKAAFPYMPVVATGGPSEDTILATIRAGADAISFTPPSIAEIFSKQMEILRAQL